MNLVLDIGNTRNKAALFENDVLIEKKLVNSCEDLHNWQLQYPIQNALFSSVGKNNDTWISCIQATSQKIILSPSLPLPIQIHYTTPETLGVDRIASVCGALALFPQKNCLIIDIGTCINYEFIDTERNYWGGAISPGIEMRFQAMHQFTERLPLVTNVDTQANLIGNNTISCLQSGVIHGISGEITGFIEQYAAKYSSLCVLICGGGASFFEKKLKPTIFASPDLVLVGLNRILNHNALH